MEPTTKATEPTGTQRGGNAPANVSVGELTAMLKRKPAPAAAGTSASPVNGAAKTGAKETTTTTKAATGVVAEGSSSEGSEGTTEQAGQETALAQQEGTEAATRTEGAAEGAEGPHPDPLPEGEGNEEGDGEEGAAEGSEEAEGAEVPKPIREMKRRIDKLTKKLRTAEAELERSRVAAEQARRPETAAAVGSPAGVDPRFAKDEALVNATQGLTQIDAIADRAEDLMDQLNRSGDETVEFQGHAFGRTELRKILRNAQAQRSELTSQKAARVERLEQEFQNSLTQHNAIAVKAYPWMAEPESEEFQLAKQILQSNAGVAMRPDRAVLIGDLIAGRKARLAAGKVGAQREALTGQARPPGKTKPAPVPTTGSAGSARVDAGALKLKEAEAAFQKSGRTKDLTALLKVKRMAAAGAA